MTAAVLATAAVAAVTVGGLEVSAAADGAVRAEVAVAGEGHPLDVRRIRIVDGLRPGASYRLPALGVRNHGSVRTTYRLVVSSGAAEAATRRPRRWLRFVPPTVTIDAGRSRAVGVRLDLGRDADPGAYAVVLGVRPGGPKSARLTFRVEPAESRGLPRRAPGFALWLVPALAGAALVVVRARLGA
jgi:hypothetical protein